jgi:hypothetical protein
MPVIECNEATDWLSYAICDDCGIKGPWFAQIETADIYAGEGYGNTREEIFSKIVACARTGVSDRNAFLCLPCARIRRGY